MLCLLVGFTKIYLGGTHTQDLNHEETDKPKLKDILGNKWPTFFKNINARKDKGRPWNCPGFKRHKN